ncbi:ABC transporter ATP-binding protein [Enterococcus sp.]|jgi:ABC-2 type transport system ATP-binding protein|uniref:ABC transporter ATP-binding protein n=1 Tax=Enterococcus sp. TaxID=35783 RepID=UPI0025C18ABF|nr:ABC transporter ATP-binding protein [Enterococcus sp.]
MESILSLNQVTKKYGQQYALDQVSLTIQKGAVYGLIGRNGAGKTTLLKAITRLISTTSGTVSLLGSKTDSEWIKALRRTGSVIETPVAYDQLTAKENLEYYCKLRGIVDRGTVIQETLELVDLTDTDNKKFKDFSLGMKQKLGIAIAILSKPDLLILDEPINGLDPIAIAAFRHLIKRLNEEYGMTIIISSHILSELYQVATCFGIINNGVLIKEIAKTDFDQLSEDYIVLKTSETPQASALLKENFSFKMKIINQTELHLFERSHQINEITRLLVTNNISIDGIYYQKQDLENYFTNLIDDTEDITHD